MSLRRVNLTSVTTLAVVVDVQSGDVVVLDASRCRAMSCMFDRSRPWGRTRRAVYLFAAASSRAAAVANVSGRRRRRAALLELDPGGLQGRYRRGGAIAATTSHRGRVRSVTQLADG